MVWISDAMLGTSSIKGFVADVVLNDRKRSIEVMNLNRLGELQPEGCFPNEVYAKYKDKKEKKQPHLFMAGGFWTVSSDCADVLNQFDLGAGKLYPVKLLQHDRTTPVDGKYFCLNFGAQKTAVLTDQSPQIRRPYENHDIWKPPLAPTDKGIAVSAAALEGPDIWIDTQLRDAFFVSDALAQALRAAKVSRPFQLRKCIVL